MPHPATSLPADTQQDAVELPDFDALYEVDVELLRGCRRPLTPGSSRVVAVRGWMRPDRQTSLPRRRAD
jgi:hypothetical protein